ncbi:hypothetical protein [Winogradskyella alexanderae]|uniref:V-type ATP synthase subunit E n=1 Tax=Winogradskyella alexanderae TaxID=2877123 RepID=A0ABS7XR03_9FLAO|nr:hypothetical protein [Winogradskyella alexanderae]MCA0132195.1 hypothetical protein [Winogradskyella alexanderae]
MSEQTLDGLIAKVKSEAIEASELEAQSIINDAKLKAKQIINKAEADKRALIKDAEVHAEGLVKKGKIALNQAARDVQISVKNDIHNLFKSVLEAEVKEAFTTDLYTKVISKVMDSLGGKVAVTLPKDMEDEMIKSLQNSLATSKSVPQIIKKNNLLSGLSVTKIDEGWSYDITAEEIAELLSQHLSPKWAEILKNA